MQVIFPRTNIFLCSVHILRAIQKNFKSKVSGIFYQNPDLLYIWRVLSGSLFLNLCDENILNEIITFLNGCDFLIDDIYRAGFLEFKHYLIKYYLSPGSPFNPGNFDYYNSILMEGYMTTSTNCLESLNRQLKDLSGSGYLSFNRTCGIIKDFKVHFIQMHEKKIVNDQINKRKKRALNRENMLKDILDNFYDLPYGKQLSSTISKCKTS